MLGTRSIPFDWAAYQPDRSAEWNADRLTNQITKAAEWSIGRVNTNNKPHPWWNDKLNSIKIEKRKLQRQLTTSLKKRKPELYSKLRRDFNHLKHLLQRRIKEGNSSGESV